MLKGIARVILSLVVVTSLLAKAVPLQLSSEPLQGSEWRIETVDFTENVGHFTSIALDRSGRPHIGHYDETNRDLKYSWWNGSAWINETVDTDGHAGYSISIKLDDNGIPHISYQQYHPDVDLKYAWKEGGVWHDEIVDSAGAVGYDTSMVLDGKGKPHISYYDHAKGDLKFAWKNGDDWKYMAVDSPGVVGQYTSMALDLNGNFHISYFDYENGDLKHAWKDGSTWKNETVDSSGNVGYDTSIAFDSNGYPHISYYDQTNKDLKHAWKDGNTWKNETVDSSGNVGFDTSIAFDGHGDPHISYYDQTKFNLKHAWWNGTVWKNEIVDSIGDVGRYASMVIDNKSIPHISYYSRPYSDLKYATKVKLQGNNPPVADAGPDQTVNEGDIVQFSASNSSGEGQGFFEADVKVDDSPKKASFPEVKVDDVGVIHVVWTDTRDWPSQGIYYTKSTDGGKTFLPAVSVTDKTSGAKIGPAFDLGPNGWIHVAWMDVRGSSYDIYYANSKDGGMTFGDNTKVNDDSFFGGQGSPDIAVDENGVIHVAWRDGRSHDTDIYYANSTDGGNSFSTNLRVNDYDGASLNYAVTVIDTDSNGTPHVAWEDKRNTPVGGERQDIYYATFSDSRDGFGPNVRVTDDVINRLQASPSIVVTPADVIYLVWDDWRDDDDPYDKNDVVNISYSRSFDLGKTFTSNLRLTDTGHTYNPTLAVDRENNLHIAWRKGRWSQQDHNATDIYYAKFMSSGVPLREPVLVNDGNDGQQFSPSISTDMSNVPHVVWYDDREHPGLMAYHIYYAKGNGSGGQPSLNFDWDFDASVDSDGEGNYTNDVDATGQSPTHVYQDNGNYTVTLKVTDDSGLWDTDTCVVTVLNVPPASDANGPYQGFEGTPVQFVGNHTDPGTLDTHTYEWDFSYDGTTFIPEATGNPFQKTWYDDHAGNIALRVTDDDGGWDLDVTTVTIVNVPPIADAGDDKEGYEVSTFTFNGSFYDPGAGDTHTYEWDFDYDGVSFGTDATGQTVSHTWTDDFDGQIALRVTDDDGGADVDTAHVLVKNVPPTVTLEVLPIEVDAFLRIAGEKWHDVSIELFEDGVLIANGTLVRYPGSPNEQMLDLSNLQFDHSKNYTATVTYTPDDDPINGQTNGANPCWIMLRFSDGQELWIHHTFNVNHPDTYVWEVDLTAAILSHGMTFEATAFDPGADELTFHWDFGDGINATSFYSNGNWTYPVQITETINHVFPGSGTYVVVLTVEDDDGGVGTASLTIVIP